MKIFSLESKLDIVIWSIVFGFVVDFLLNLIVIQIPCFGFGCGELGAEGILRSGFPVYTQFQSSDFVETNLYGLIFNAIFWILVSLIILSLIRYFKNKNGKSSSATK